MTGRRDAGMATAELAVVLPVLVLLVAAGMTAGSALLAELRCVDAAREAARVAARGETVQAARSAGARAGPAGAVVQVVATGTEVTVTVSAGVAPTRGLLPSFRVQATGVAVREPASDVP